MSIAVLTSLAKAIIGTKPLVACVEAGPPGMEGLKVSQSSAAAMVSNMAGFMPPLKATAFMRGGQPEAPVAPEPKVPVLVKLTLLPLPAGSWASLPAGSFAVLSGCARRVHLAEVVKAKRSKGSKENIRNRQQPALARSKDYGTEKNEPLAGDLRTKNQKNKKRADEREIIYLMGKHTTSIYYRIFSNAG